MERAADARRRRALFDIPRRRGVDRGHGDVGVLHGLDDGRERLPNFSRKAETWTRLASDDGWGGRDSGRRTEDGVDDMVGRLEGGGKVVDKGDFEVLKLLGQALRIRVSIVAGSGGGVFGGKGRKAKRAHDGCHIHGDSWTGPQ